MTFPRPRAMLALLGASTLLLAGCSTANGDAENSSTGDTIKLSYAYFAPATSFPSKQMEEWATQLNERTDGQVEVELFLGGTLLGAGDIYEGVSQGVVDLGLDSPAYDTVRFPMSSVINVPMGLTDPGPASQAFLELLTEYEPEEFDGYEIITAFTTEASFIQSSTAIASQGDMRGTTIRGAAATLPILEELGTSPVGLPMNEVSEQMNTGVIDGYASSREVLTEFGLAESVDYITDYPLNIGNSFVAVMDQDRFDALPADVQEVIRDLKEEMSQWAAREHVRSVEEALGEAADQGVETLELSQAEAAEWEKILEGRADAWGASQSDAPFDAQEVLDRVRELADVSS